MESIVSKSREELEKLTVKQLLKDYATPLEIKNRHDMKKAELIEAILEVYAGKDDNKEELPKKKESKGLTDVQIENKMRYIDNANIGDIVAFKLPGMKAKSAKIIRKSTKNKKFKVETAYGMQYVITYDNVLWVKTNRRWPKGVYLLLKGIEKE